MRKILSEDLNPTLHYHGLHHTDDVIRVSMEIGREERLSAEDLATLRVAAVFHDAGFLSHYRGHEEASCALAKKILPSFHFPPSLIDAICSMIMATKIPQSPKNKIEEILCDADLDYLGRNDVHEIAHSLFEEMKVHTGLTDENEWDEIQIRFLQHHQYYTAFSRKNRQPAKEAYLAELMHKRTA